MPYSITHALYDWMHKRRIVTEVAREMGKRDVTLSAELRPSTPNAKLGADELIPLFNAIRAVGYGRELEGILHQFVAGIHGTDGGADPCADTATCMLPHVVVLAKSLHMLFDCADRVTTLTDQNELVRLSTMLRTEVLPAVLQMDRMVQARLNHTRPAGEKSRPIVPLAPELNPTSSI